MNGTQAGDRLQMLVIEDDETVGQPLQSGLQCNGYDASRCPTGETRLTLTRKSPPRASAL
jgi:DNA-binding response OmpR family regulator